MEYPHDMDRKKPKDIFMLSGQRPTPPFSTNGANYLTSGMNHARKM